MKRSMTRLGIVLIIAVAANLAGCGGGSKVLKEPVKFTPVEPLISTSDNRLEIVLDWVIIRNGPGTWARNADWDEYLLRVKNISAGRIRITEVTIVDSMEIRLRSSADRKKLVEASRSVASRYKGEDIKVMAGTGGAALMAAGGAAFYAGLGIVSYAALSGSAAVASAAGAAAVGLVAAPVLVVGGIVRSQNNNKVTKEIATRSKPLPIDLFPGEERGQSFFFPLAPSPKKLEFTYLDSEGEHFVAININELLYGLHLGENADPAPQSGKQEQ